LKRLAVSTMAFALIVINLIGSQRDTQSSVGMDKTIYTRVVLISGSRFLSSSFDRTHQLDGIIGKYPDTATDGTSTASTALADGIDFNATIEVYKMIDVDGVNSTTADDTAYNESWTIYLYKDGNLFDQQTTGTDGFFTWRNLGPGSYRVIEADVDGWINMSPKNHDFGVVLGNHSYSFTFRNFKFNRLNTTLTLDFPTTTIQLFPVILKATLRDERGNPVQGARIWFHFPGGGISMVTPALTDANGTAAITPPYYELFSTLQIMVTFDGTSEYVGSTATSTIIVQPIAAYILIVIIVVATFGILLKKRKNRPP